MCSYLEVMISKDGCGKAEDESRIMAGRRVRGTLKSLVNEKHKSVDSTESLQKGVVSQV